MTVDKHHCNLTKLLPYGHKFLIVQTFKNYAEITKIPLNNIPHNIITYRLDTPTYNHVTMVNHEKQRRS